MFDNGSGDFGGRSTQGKCLVGISSGRRSSAPGKEHGRFELPELSTSGADPALVEVETWRGGSLAIEKTLRRANPLKLEACARSVHLGNKCIRRKGTKSTSFGLNVECERRPPGVIYDALDYYVTHLWPT